MTDISAQQNPKARTRRHREDGPARGRPPRRPRVFELSAPQKEALVLIAAVEEFRASRKWFGVAPWVVLGRATQATPPSPAKPLGRYVANRTAAHGLAKALLVSFPKGGHGPSAEAGVGAPVLTDYGRELAAKLDDDVAAVGLRGIPLVPEEPPEPEAVPEDAARNGEVDVVCGTTVNVWEEHVDEHGMFRVFRGLLAHFRSRGWDVRQDPEAAQRYPELAARRYVGSKGDLRIHMESFGRHLSAELYQELDVENPNGGRYDFHKFERMPRRLRLPCVVEMAAAVARLVGAHGYAVGKNLSECPRGDAPLPWRVLHAACQERQRQLHVAQPLATFNKSWGSHGIARGQDGWPASVDGYGGAWQNADREGVVLRPGDVRHFRDYRGRLHRGAVHPNMNGMWSIRYGGEITYVPARDLFTAGPLDLEQPRLAPGGARKRRALLAAAVKAENYARVAVLGEVLRREAERAAAGPEGGPSHSPEATREV